MKASSIKGEFRPKSTKIEGFWHVTLASWDVFGSLALKIGELRELIWLFWKNKILFFESFFFSKNNLGFEKKIWKISKISDLGKFECSKISKCSKISRFCFSKPKLFFEKNKLSKNKILFFQNNHIKPLSSPIFKAKLPKTS